MLELDSTVKVETEESERIAVFSLDGITYDMPAEIKPHVGLKYLWLVKEEGSDYATAWLLEAVLGKAGFQALSDYEPLTTAQFKIIADTVQTAALGTLEDSGKAPTNRGRYSGNGPKKSRGSRTTKKT